MEFAKLPWSVRDLDGKYYGTQVVNCDGDVVATFGHDYSENSSKPSDRQLAEWKGQDFSAEYSLHYEPEGALRMALWLCDKVNAT